MRQSTVPFIGVHVHRLLFLSCILHICPSKCCKKTGVRYRIWIVSNQNAKRIEIHKQIYGDAFNNMTMTYEWGVLFWRCVRLLCAAHQLYFSHGWHALISFAESMVPGAPQVKLYAHNERGGKIFLPFNIYFKSANIYVNRYKNDFEKKKKQNNNKTFFARIVTQVECRFHFRFSWFFDIQQNRIQTNRKVTLHTVCTEWWFFHIHFQIMDEFSNAIFKRITSNKAFAEFKVLCVLKCCVDAKSFFFFASHLNSSFNDLQLTFPLGQEETEQEKEQEEEGKEKMKNNEHAQYSPFLFWFRICRQNFSNIVTWMGYFSSTTNGNKQSRKSFHMVFNPCVCATFDNFSLSLYSKYKIVTWI